MRRTIRKQLPAVVAEPVALLAEVRTHALDKRPEASRVIEVNKVAKLVHDDVVENRAGREREPPRERDRPLRRARAPPRPCVANRDPTAPNTDARSLGGDGLPHELAREPAALVLREPWRIEHANLFGVQLPREPGRVGAQGCVDRTVA